jgi:hypothetical protein
VHQQVLADVPSSAPRRLSVEWPLPSTVTSTSRAGSSAGVRTELEGAPDNDAQALPGVTAVSFCRGCVREFAPVRTNQTHCSPRCRVSAYRKRRAEAPAGGSGLELKRRAQAGDAALESIDDGQATDDRSGGNGDNLC